VILDCGYIKDVCFQITLFDSYQLLLKDIQHVGKNSVQQLAAVVRRFTATIKIVTHTHHFIY